MTAHMCMHCSYRVRSKHFLQCSLPFLLGNCSICFSEGLRRFLGGVNCACVCERSLACKVDSNSSAIFFFPNTQHHPCIHQRGFPSLPPTFLMRQFPSYGFYRHWGGEGQMGKHQLTSCWWWTWYASHLVVIAWELGHICFSVMMPPVKGFFFLPDL